MRKPHNHETKKHPAKNIKEIIETIAQLKNMNTEDCTQILWENAEKLVFGGKK